MTKIQLLEANIDRTTFSDKKLPSDVHLITFINTAGELQVDVVRAYTMADIFDIYYDRVKGKGKIKAIESGFGTIRPYLYGKIKEEGEAKE